MGTINPYASPQAVDEVVPTAFPDGEGYYRDGKLLVVKNGAELPDRCVYCNEPSGAYRKDCNPFWISFVHGIFRRVDVGYGICREHRRRREMQWVIRIAIAGLWISTVYFLPQFNNLFSYDQFPMGWFLLVIVILSISNYLSELWSGVGLRVCKADNSKVWLRSAGKPFLASLGEAEE